LRVNKRVFVGVG